MNQQTLDSFVHELQRRRADILARVAHTQEELQDLAAEEESEWSDSALEEDTKHLLARLDVRETTAIREIDRALERIREGTYGICVNCGQTLSNERLQAMPTAQLCANCALTLEPPASVAAEENLDANVQAAGDGNPEVETEDDIPASGRVPPDLSLLSDE